MYYGKRDGRGIRGKGKSGGWGKKREIEWRE